MDNRCAVCEVDLGSGKLSQSIIARMEIECSHCKNLIRLNVHSAEMAIVLLNGALMLALAASAYLYESQTLTLSLLGAVVLGMLGLPLIEHTYLKTWPRYARMAGRAEGEIPKS